MVGTMTLPIGLFILVCLLCFVLGGLAVAFLVWLEDL
jgi:hypothetical protein